MDPFVDFNLAIMDSILTERLADRRIYPEFVAVENSEKEIKIGEYLFNLTSQTLEIEGKATSLSYFEARILHCLAKNLGQTVAASELMIAVWQRDDPSNRNSLHGYIHKLRHALRQDSTVAIINQRGFGYMLTVKQ